MNKYQKELVLWAFIVLPYVYIATIWNKLPELVPTHFNIEGVANDWSSKTSLLFVPCALGIGIYFLMLIIPKIDPKKKIQEMGDKYYSLRFILTVFISLLATYLLYLSNTGSLKKPNFLFALIGMLLAILGNYFQTLRPNYFIGIRTPWTLKNEQVWKNTHRLGGWLWIGGGILMAILAFLISNNYLNSMMFGVIILIIVIVPILFSYTEYRKEKNILNK
jgi:uncharacterized membrane protein